MDGNSSSSLRSILDVSSVQDFILWALQHDCKFSEAVIEYEKARSGDTFEKLIGQMREMLNIMRNSMENGLKGNFSLIVLPGGDARRLDLGRRSVAGEPLSLVIKRAIAAAESNANMEVGVACPTLGSLAVVPAVLVTVGETVDAEEDDVLRALFAAAGIGMVVATNASVAGAEVGCQGEIGTASAMAAAAAVELLDGTPEQVGHAAAIALKNLIGLPCDPVCGLVEEPCVSRNAMGAANALVAAEMALTGVISVIPVDEVIAVMADVGKQLPASLRETGEGGLANAPTAVKLKQRIFGEVKEISCDGLPETTGNI